MSSPSAVGRVRLPITPRPMPAASTQPQATPQTPAPEASPQQPGRVIFPQGPGTDFGRLAEYHKQACAQSMWECAKVTCQYQGGVRRTTLLTPESAAEKDVSLVREHKCIQNLAEERYKIAKKNCDRRNLPPPAPPGAIFAEGEREGRGITFYHKPENWFSPVEPVVVPATPAFWTQVNPMNIESVMEKSAASVVRNATRTGPWGQMSTGQQAKFIGMVLVLGAAMSAYRAVTATFSFVTTPPEDFFTPEKDS